MRPQPQEAKRTARRRAQDRQALLTALAFASLLLPTGPAAIDAYADAEHTAIQTPCATTDERTAADR